MEEKIVRYDDARFELAENLKGKPKEIAEKQGIEKGLVVITVNSHSVPKWTVEKVVGSPTAFIRKKAKEEGVDLSRALDRAFGSENE